VRPMTTVDGAWNAICATDRDRTTGTIHCYPSNHDPAQIFKGIAAGFIQVEGGGGLKTHAIAVLNVVSQGGRQFFEVQVHCFGRTAYAAEPRRILNESGGKPLSRLWDDPEHSMFVAAVSTRHSCFDAYIFDSATGDMLCTHTITEHGDERVYCGSGGLHVENEGRTLKRLQLHPGGLVLDTLPTTMTFQSPIRATDPGPPSSPSATTFPPSTPLGRIDTSSTGSMSVTTKKRRGVGGGEFPWGQLPLNPTGSSQRRRVRLDHLPSRT